MLPHTARTFRIFLTLSACLLAVSGATAGNISTAAITEHLLGREELPASQLELADANGDGFVDISDVIVDSTNTFTPTPTATPTPTLSPSPTPTSTPSPTVTPTPTSTLAPNSVTVSTSLLDGLVASGDTFTVRVAITENANSTDVFTTALRLFYDAQTVKFENVVFGNAGPGLEGNEEGVSPNNFLDIATFGNLESPMPLPVIFDATFTVVANSPGTVNISIGADPQAGNSVTATNFVGIPATFDSSSTTGVAF